MTADAEFIDRFAEHELVIAGMGIMTGHASLAFYNTMDIRQRFLFSNQVLHVAVTGDAERHRTLGPELITVVVAMGVVAEGTTPDVQGSMDRFAGRPGFFAGMAGETDVLDI
jgi:hypothetical protein